VFNSQYFKRDGDVMLAARHVTSSIRWHYRDASVQQGGCRRSECWRSGRRWVWRSWCSADQTQTVAERTSRCRRSHDESPGVL